MADPEILQDNDPNWLGKYMVAIAQEPHRSLRGFRRRPDSTQKAPEPIEPGLEGEQ
jgi:hypothetical protein